MNKKIVIDTMGSDNGYQTIVEGAIKIAKEIDDLEIYLFGPESINSMINNIPNLKLVVSSEEITNYDIPTQAIRQKKESSLVKAYDFLKENNDINVMISAGSSGAVLSGAIMKLERINKCRPGLMALLPNENNKLFALMDCGINVDCKAEYLLGFAKMANCYLKTMLNIENPRIALLSNGVEEGKGNELVKEATKLLKESNLHFIGNVEGNKVLNDVADIVLCDGFSGNVILKNIEGTAKTIIKELYLYQKKLSELEQIGVNKVIKNLMSKYDFNALGGGILLGVNKIVIKAHGAATADSIYNIAKQAYNLAANNIIDNMKSALE